MFLASDIQSVIVQFINNFEGFLTFRHVCKDTYYQIFVVNFMCHRTYNFVITPHIKINTYSFVRYNTAHIRSLICDRSVDDRFIKKLPNLTKLDCFVNIQLTSTAIQSLKNLTYLNCGDIKLNDTMFKHLKNITTLICSSSNKLTDNTLISLPNLTHLDCGSNKFTNEGLKHLSKLLYLKIVNEKKFTVQGYKHLINLTDLYCYTGIHPDIVRVLPALKKIKYGNYNYTDYDISHLTNLRELSCTINCRLTDTSFNAFKYLTVLSITDCRNIIISDNALSDMHYLVGLTLINSSRLNLTDSALCNKTNLTYLQCDSIPLTDTALKTLTKLTTLHLYEHEGITDQSVKTLTALTTLTCGSNTNLTDNTLVSLPNLIYLDCGTNINFTLVGLLHFKTITRLSYILSDQNSNADNYIFDRIMRYAMKNIEQCNW